MMTYSAGSAAWRRTVWTAWLLGMGCLGQDLTAATLTPARIGVVDVELEFSASGSSSGLISDATGTASWEDSYDFQLRSRAAYEVLQKGTNAYTGEELSANSTLSVTGGGRSTVSAKAGTFTTTWRYLPASGFDPEAAYVAGGYYSADGSAWAGTAYLPSVVLDPPDATAMTDGSQAAIEAALAADPNFDFSVPRTIEGWFRSDTHSGSVEYSSPFFPASSRGSAICTVRVRFTPDDQPQWEAILEVDPPLVTTDNPAYADWLPRGALKEASEFPGNALAVRVHLEPKEGAAGIPPKARYRFLLLDVSREPGILMNFPAREAPGCDTVPSGPFDLKIYPSETIHVADDGQSADTEVSVSEAGVAVASYDFGSYGRLKVLVDTDDGQSLVAHRKGKPDESVLDIPLDENRNHVADAWEKQMGVFDRNLPASWDGIDEPAGQGVKGDGLSLYERYRGFLVLNGLGKEVFERLDPRKKHVFVRDADRIVQNVFVSPEGLPESYLAAAECEVRYVSATGWTGPGTFADRKRVVNFNCSEDKHAVDQHALHVILVTSPTPSIPKDADDLRTSVGLSPYQPLGRRTEGCAYRDATCPDRAWNEWRPAANYRTEIYGAAVQAYVHDTLIYHTEAACPGCTRLDITNAAMAYATNHAIEASRKYTIELSATITHEMGHGTGVRHHAPVSDSPDDNTLKNCTMRYYDPDEFPPNPADRFELDARGNNPDSFCRRKHNCWQQLKISDNLDAAAGTAPFLAASVESPVPTDGARPMNLVAAALVPPLPIPEPTHFELSADLAWEDLVEGDPLRFTVRLHGLNDTVSASWLDGMRLRLIRLTADGREEEVLPPEAWLPFLVPSTFDTALLGIPNITRITEWLAPADRAGLTPGPYRLEIAWNGRDLAPEAGLPTNGTVSLPPIAFTVGAADTAERQARHQRRLAWERYLRDDLAGAVIGAQEAERLDPTATDPLAMQSRLVGASSALRLRDPLAAAQILERMNHADAAGNDHLAAEASEVFESLSPRLSLAAGPTGGITLPARLQISVLPGGTYVLERSPDLRNWTPVSTNSPAGGDYAVEDSMGERGRFYRVVWLR